MFKDFDAQRNLLARSWLRESSTGPFEAVPGLLKLGLLAPWRKRFQLAAERPTMPPASNRSLPLTPSSKHLKKSAEKEGPSGQLWVLSGLSEFFPPRKEILIVSRTEDVLEILRQMPESERRAIGERARGMPVSTPREIATFV